MISKIMNQTLVFVSNRSNRNTLLTVTLLSFFMGFFNGASLHETTVSVERIQKLILDGLVITKDPTLLENRESILDDYDNRISDEFTIPAGLRQRVGFWFDIYSRYDSNKKVIHHTRYPWIVFKVVDISDIINSDTPRVRWLRNVKADKFVTAEVEKFSTALNEIARTGTLDPANEYHRIVSDAMESLPGTPKSKAKEALDNIRVQTGQKNFFSEGLEVSPLYLQGMEEIFQNHNLPVELTRLPFVESSFNRHAVSKVGASGIWQFMDYTGKSFMTVNDHIDERKSPFKATVAAARLLKENHMILHRSWPLAITAWNHGPSGIRKAMKAANSKDISEIVNGYQSKTFDFASSNFYAEFLAALYTEKYKEQIFENLQYEKNLDLHTVRLARAIPAKDLLRRSGLAKEDFVLFNPDLNKALERNIPVPSGFSIMVDTPARQVLRKLITKDTRESKVAKISQSEISFNMESNTAKN